MGSNMAENHPIAFRFVLEAKDKGATIIHVDPRFTRTSALADIYAPIRAGSDIAFLGGLIRYILEEDLWFKEYALAYTNMSTIIDERFQDATALDGMFSGLDAGQPRPTNTIPGNTRARTCRHRSPSTMSTPPKSYSEKSAHGKGPAAARPQPAASEHGLPDPEAALCRLHAGEGRGSHWLSARHLSEGGRGADVSFGPRAHRRVLLCGRLDASHRRRPDYSRRGADPGVARQYRAAGRRRAGIARSFEHPGQHRHPDPLQHAAELPAAAAGGKSRTTRSKDYLESETPPTGLWHNFPKYAVSLLRAWYGEHATPENQWGLSMDCRASSAIIRNCR